MQEPIMFGNLLIVDYYYKDPIDPDHLIPVHTENSEWFVDKYESTVILKDGQTIQQ